MQQPSTTQPFFSLPNAGTLSPYQYGLLPTLPMGGVPDLSQGFPVQPYSPFLLSPDSLSSAAGVVPSMGVQQYFAPAPETSPDIVAGMIQLKILEHQLQILQLAANSGNAPAQKETDSAANLSQKTLSTVSQPLATETEPAAAELPSENPSEIRAEIQTEPLAAKETPVVLPQLPEKPASRTEPTKPTPPAVQKPPGPGAWGAKPSAVVSPQPVPPKPVQASPSLSPTTNAPVTAAQLRLRLNPRQFNVQPPGARFFVIKSLGEEDVHKSIKHGIWASTDMGNRRLNTAFQEAGKSPVYLFFSVNASGQFCGVAQMMSPVDFLSKSTVWTEQRWNGQFSVKWIFVKDIPNAAFRHILLKNNENRPITNSRDTQDILYPEGCETLRIFATFKHNTSLLDDYDYYEQKHSTAAPAPAQPVAAKTAGVSPTVRVASTRKN
eukprot:TRINITY_DN2485_c0_g1_i2.p1 TRINITY_DN2485_c0_g1~~TRINITY_DN2485_c0_g1_i2.p1  ORF type:complete len:473 (+),score=99.10 TRINITY_DN2485_c0_g1_i2:111-1421(+)